MTSGPHFGHPCSESNILQQNAGRVSRDHVCVKLSENAEEETEDRSAMKHKAAIILSDTPPDKTHLKIKIERCSQSPDLNRSQMLFTNAPLPI